MFEMKLYWSTTSEEIEDWISSNVESLSENGSTVATGQSYHPRGEGAPVQDLNGSYVHHLGCPFKL